MHVVRHQAILFIKIYERVDFSFLFYSLWLELWNYFIHFILFTVVIAILFTVVRVILFTVVTAMELSVHPSLTFLIFFFFFWHFFIFFIIFCWMHSVFYL